MKNRKWKRMSAAAIIATMTVTGGAYAWADEFKTVSINDAKQAEEVTAPVVDTTEETPIVDAVEDNLYEESSDNAEELVAVYQERIAKLNELIAIIDDEDINDLLANAVERFESKIEELESEDDTAVEEPTEGDDDTEVEEPTEQTPVEEDESTEADELAKKKEQLAFKIAVMTKVYDQVGSDQARAAIQKNMDKFQAQLDALNEEAPVEEAPVVEEPTEEAPTEEVVEEETTPVVAPVAKNEEKKAEKAAKKAEKEAAKAAKKAEQQAKVAEKKAAAEAKKVEAQAKAVAKKAEAEAKAAAKKAKAEVKKTAGQAKAEAKKEEKGNKGKGNK